MKDAEHLIVKTIVVLALIAVIVWVSASSIQSDSARVHCLENPNAVCR